MENKSRNRWVVIAIVAAIVAALTTVIVLVLRARAKKRAALYSDNDFGCDADEGGNCYVFDEDDSSEETAAE